VIHHVSIPARDPRHVAQVLAELLGGYAGPFIGPIPDAWVVYQEDGPGTGIEIYPEDIALAPGTGGIRRGSAPDAVAFHALISVKAQRADIERIATREGRHTAHFWRGPPGMPLFELYEFWVENRLLLELVTEDMLESYVSIANGAAQQSLLERRGSRSSL
jgi:hypothetical protein